MLTLSCCEPFLLNSTHHKQASADLASLEDAFKNLGQIAQADLASAGNHATHGMNWWCKMVLLEKQLQKLNLPPTLGAGAAAAGAAAAGDVAAAGVAAAGVAAARDGAAAAAGPSVAAGTAAGTPALPHGS
jgi:hypothetical protein